LFKIPLFGTIVSGVSGGPIFSLGVEGLELVGVASTKALVRADNSYMFNLDIHQTFSPKMIEMIDRIIKGEKVEGVEVIRKLPAPIFPEPVRKRQPAVNTVPSEHPALWPRDRKLDYLQYAKEQATDPVAITNIGLLIQTASKIPK